MLAYFRKHRILLASAAVFTFAACSKPKATDHVAPVQDELASLSMLLSENANLAGNPRIYNFSIKTSRGEITERSGNLPAQGTALTIHNLPVDDAATVTADLYTLSIEPRYQTHSCSAAEPVKLEPGASASIALTCIPVTAGPSADIVKVFLKIAKASVTLTEGDVSSVLKQRDLEGPMVLSHKDSRDRRITIKQTTHGIAFNLGGEIGYYAARTEADRSPLNALIAGEEITLTATTGSLLQSVPEPAVLRLASSAMLYEAEDGSLKIALPFILNNTVNTVGFSGTLFEEGPSSEFTVVSYNVENLFDQSDDERNAHYGDFRITPNEKGQSSNWGSTVDADGKSTTFTDIKIAGIRRTLQAIDPAGPEIVGLVEIESKDAVNALVDGVKDLGYAYSAFTEWKTDVVQNAIGLGLISKYPVKSATNLHIAPSAPNEEPARPILKVTLDVQGHDFIVYVNHWKSKSGPESQRIASAQALEDDLRVTLDKNPRADYVIMGDLNSNYNENVTITDEHNDSEGKTGINSVLNAQGNELDVVNIKKPYIKYNLHYELDRAARRTGWHNGHGWSSLDHMIIGPGLYDMRGITYVDNSFQVAAAHMSQFSFLFNEDGTTNRWKQTRESPSYTRHDVGGYSDHLPLFARFRIAPVQDSWTIYLYMPSKPDSTDVQ